jgi:outer membrane protein OmpA-like peptidoglycan-associated protein
MPACSLKKFGMGTLLLMVFISSNCFGQNRVKNPDFEDFDECPTTFGLLESRAHNWSVATLGSSDFFHSCSSAMPAGLNFIGNQMPFNGEAYAGIYMYGPKDYREYIAASLKGHLIKDQKYLISFRISLADKSGFAVDRFGILFTKKPLKLRINRNIPIDQMERYGYKNFLEIKNQKYYDNNEEWVEITGEYVADGTEKFMIIGNFRANNSTRIKKKGENLKKAAYYYIDMMSVQENPLRFRLDEPYVINNLSFETNDFSIAEAARPQLESLATYLNSNPDLNVLVLGHTDNMGSDEHNTKLSKKRARAVADFLADNGVDEKKIMWQGYGDLRPITTNEIEKERLKNRRVEFMISDRLVGFEGALSLHPTKDKN